jgi:hypothetical protein
MNIYFTSTSIATAERTIEARHAEFSTLVDPKRSLTMYEYMIHHFYVNIYKRGNGTDLWLIERRENLYRNGESFSKNVTLIIINTCIANLSNPSTTERRLRRKWPSDLKEPNEADE